jgi:hypothetical protein
MLFQDHLTMKWSSGNLREALAKIDDFHGTQVAAFSE